MSRWDFWFTTYTSGKLNKPEWCKNGLVFKLTLKCVQCVSISWSELSHVPCFWGVSVNKLAMHHETKFIREKKFRHWYRWQICVIFSLWVMKFGHNIGVRRFAKHLLYLCLDTPASATTLPPHPLSWLSCDCDVWQMKGEDVRSFEPKRLSV